MCTARVNRQRHRYTSGASNAQLVVVLVMIAAAVIIAVLWYVNRTARPARQRPAEAASTAQVQETEVALEIEAVEETVAAVEAEMPAPAPPAEMPVEAHTTEMETVAATEEVAVVETTPETAAMAEPEAVGEEPAREPVTVEAAEEMPGEVELETVAVSETGVTPPSGTPVETVAEPAPVRVTAEEPEHGLETAVPAIPREEELLEGAPQAGEIAPEGQGTVVVIVPAAPAPRTELRMPEGPIMVTFMDPSTGVSRTEVIFPGKSRKTGVGRQETEDRIQRAEVGGQREEAGSQRPEVSSEAGYSSLDREYFPEVAEDRGGESGDRRQETGDRIQRPEVGGQRAEVSDWQSVARTQESINPPSQQSAADVLVLDTIVARQERARQRFQARAETRPPRADNVYVHDELIDGPYFGDQVGDYGRPGLAAKPLEPVHPLVNVNGPYRGPTEGLFDGPWLGGMCRGGARIVCAPALVPYGLYSAFRVPFEADPEYGGATNYAMHVAAQTLMAPFTIAFNSAAGAGGCAADALRGCADVCTFGWYGMIERPYDAEPDTRPYVAAVLGKEED